MASLPGVSVRGTWIEVTEGCSPESDFLIGIVDWARLEELKKPDGTFHAVDLFMIRPKGKAAAGRSLLHQFAHAKPPALDAIPATDKKPAVPRARQHIRELWIAFAYHLCDSAKTQAGSVEVYDSSGMTPLGVAASQTNGYFFKMLVEKADASSLSSSVVSN